MRVISTNETIDVPYEFSSLCVSSGSSSTAIVTETLSGWEPVGVFDTEAEAVQEMRRIRKAFEAGDKVHIIKNDGHTEMPADELTDVRQLEKALKDFGCRWHRVDIEPPKEGKTVYMMYKVEDTRLSMQRIGYCDRGQWYVTADTRAGCYVKSKVPDYWMPLFPLQDEME